MEIPEIGTLILRPVRNGAALDVVPEETEQGSLMLRAIQVHEFRTADFEAWVASPANSPGVVCFCHYEIPGDWIYLEVKGHSKNKNCVFVRPIVGKMEELLSKYQ